LGSGKKGTATSERAIKEPSKDNCNWWHNITLLWTEKFIIKACHSIDTYETDAIGDAKRIYEKIDMGIVHKELSNQSESVSKKVSRWLDEFGGTVNKC
jgi:hypothetical protein